MMNEIKFQLLLIAIGIYLLVGLKVAEVFL